MEQYINKSALVAEIDKRLHQLTDAAFDSMIGKNLIEIKDFIDALEVKKIGVDLGDHKGDKSAKYIIDTKTLDVKEVDLEKEINEHWDEWAKMDGFHSIDFAKHFFELGLKARKEEVK
jgi:hypothetical protein